MIGENWQLVTNELVGFEKYPVEFQDCKTTVELPIIFKESIEYIQFNKGKPEDVNM